MSPWSSPAINLLPALEQRRREAKQFARDGHFEQSNEKNRQLEKESREHGSCLGEVLGVRFQGLCAYRLEDLPRSEELLRKALELALAHGLHQQELHVANHLGATLRRLGKLDEVYDMFRGALDKVVLPADIEIKARLLGNLGAFYDEIGNESGADDCYARYEELIELLVLSGDADDMARLANARALSARAALRRGDWETARKKHDEEFKLAYESKDELRQRNALFHRAKMRLKLGLRAQANGEEATEYFKDAQAGLEDANRLFKKDKQNFRLADVLHAEGQLFEAQGQWAEAYDAWKQAYDISARGKQAYRQAQSSLALAQFCQRWALHGESLYWFRQAARIHDELYVPIAANKRIAGIAHARVVELRDVATSLLEEARSVQREQDELVGVREIVDKITGKSKHEVSPVKDQDVYEWQKRIRQESRERWEKLLSPARFARLKKLSQDDLVMADVLYHGVIDELPRSALLLAIVVERELRERLFVPLYRAYPHSRERLTRKMPHDRSTTFGYLNSDYEDSVTLGTAMIIIDEILRKGYRDNGVKFAQDETRVRREVLEATLRLRSSLESVTGVDLRVRLQDVRNAAAHGNEHSANIKRMMVDALRRRLLLESPMILASIIDLDLPMKP